MIPVNAVLSLVTAFDVAIQWGLGWRYLLSANFRSSVLQRWGAKRRISVLLEVTLLILGFSFVNGFLLLVFLWLFRDIFHGKLA